MAEYRAAIIGCGRRGQGRGGAFGIAEAHANAYEGCEKTILVAAADIDDENLSAFTADHQTHGYRDYHEMLEKEHPDIVSVCTWPPLHAQMTVDAAQAGAKAIWCEKPMALSMADVDRMIEACQKTGTVLQVNHLRRFGTPFQAAYQCIQSGRIGNVIAIEAFVPDWDLLSWGTHWVDMIHYFAGDGPAAWVAAQIECRSGTQKYGHFVEDHSVTYVAFKNGVRGLLELGEGCDRSTGVWVYGSEGVILANDGPDGARALVRDSAGWVQLSPATQWGQAALAALNDLLAALEDGREPLLGVTNARAATEIILAAYESAYRRGRVTLPLDVRDFPLARLVDAEQHTPAVPDR